MTDGFNVRCHWYLRYMWWWKPTAQILGGGGGGAKVLNGYPLLNGCMEWKGKCQNLGGSTPLKTKKGDSQL